MSTESINPDYQNLDTWSSNDIIKAIIDSNTRAVQAVANASTALGNASDGIQARLAAGGRLIYLGAGTSGRLAVQDAAELPPTFGFEDAISLMAGGSEASDKATEQAEDDEAAARQDISDVAVSNKDAVVGIAASGKTPYTVAGIQEARKRGAFTVGIANNPDTALLQAAEVAIFLDTGPEVLAGSTRLAAGTAQKITLNALSTSALIRLGGAYGNLMVGMKPKNHKLHGRASLIVSQAAKVSTEQARAMLEQTNWRMREAILMLKTGVSFEQAQRLLKVHQNRVRDALKAIETTL